MQNIVLRIAMVKKTFIQQGSLNTLLDRVNYNFEQGKCYAIMGRSGSGKSTLLYILAGIEKPDEGVVTCNDIPVNKAAIDQGILRKEIAIIFQQSYLIQELSVLENCSLPGLIAGDWSRHAKTRALELLEAVDLLPYANAQIGVLSGGQQQRLCIARALYNRPRFLLADEPTGNLDPHTASLILDLLLNCQKQWNMGIIISTHDGIVAASMHQKLYLHDGKLVDLEKQHKGT